MYYCEDLSLAEISEHTGKSRQGVRELIVRTSAELLEYERQLGLLEREEERKKELELILDVALKIEKSFPAEAEILRSIAETKGE